MAEVSRPPIQLYRQIPRISTSINQIVSNLLSSPIAAFLATDSIYLTITTREKSPVKRSLDQKPIRKKSIVRVQKMMVPVGFEPTRISPVESVRDGLKSTALDHSAIAPFESLTVAAQNMSVTIKISEAAMDCSDKRC